MYATALFPGIARKPPLKVGATRAALPTRRRRRETNPRAPSATSLLPAPPQGLLFVATELTPRGGHRRAHFARRGVATPTRRPPAPRRSRSAAYPRATARI